MTEHIHFFEGGNALSDFRARQLLPRLQAVAAGTTGVQARYVHLAVFDAAPEAATLEKLAALLRYGEPAAPEPAAGQGGCVIVVSPRLGTVSPWASKATDIAHNCGLAVRRIERVTEWRLQGAALTDEQRQQAAALLHDRMTESALADLNAARALFTPLQPEPMAHVDVLGAGRAALEQANADWGLALSGDEIDYLLQAETAQRAQARGEAELLGGPVREVALLFACLRERRQEPLISAAISAAREAAAHEGSA